jgi:outer membrane protein insertion porin family
MVPARALAQVDGETPPASVPPAALPSTPDDATQAPAAEDDAVQEGELVDIRIEGNRRVEAEAIRRVLRNRVGSLFDESRTAEDLRAVWSLGYFSDVQLLVQRLPTGGIVYVVRVQERPSIREVKLSGNEEISQDDLKESIEVKPFTILDMDAVRRTAKAIQAKYIDKGYFLAEVGHRVVPVAGGQSVDVIFTVEEHAKVMVKDVIFLGAEKVPADKLKAVMITREGGYLSFLTNEGTYREEAFQRDLAVIQAAYYDEGFINVRVDKPTVSLSADKRYIYITIRVTEGERYDIGKIDFSGDLVTEKERLGKLMRSRTGEHFNRSLLSQDILALTDVYYDEGYAYANINPVTSVNAEGRTVDLTFDVQKGPQVTIERIDVVGNTKTRDKVIRRELRVYEGELYSGTGVSRSKERVTALGFFESVEITQRQGSRPDTIVLQVEVKEKATGTFQVGLGFSNVENFIFTAQVSQNNFLGWGQSVSASAQISSLRSLVQLSYFDPYFLDTNFLFSADFFRVQADYEGFVRNSTGGSVSVGYQLVEDLLANVGYTQEHVDVQAAENFGGVLLANRFLSGVTSAARLSLTYDKRNNRLFPSKGFIHYGSVEYAPSFLGGSFLFTRYTAYSRLYIPLPLGAVFKTNINVGYIQQLDANRPLPISELFYVGGINSVRGYYLRSISPTLLVPRSDSPDAPIDQLNVGGNKQLLANLELEFPVLEKAGIRGVLFYDAGNAYATNERFFQDRQDKLPLGLFHSAGFGVRWFSPVGPLRFEWGIPLTKRPEDEPVLFEFTIGNFF